jgi:UDP-3-O-[3-hydroxymyristoyl] glucosamine N-acyltransferase
MNILLANPYLYGVLESDQRMKCNPQPTVISLKTRDDYNFETGEIVVVDSSELFFFGNPSYSNHSRIKVFSDLMMKGLRPKSFIHEKAIAAKDLNLGFGTVIYPNALIDSEVVLGFNSIIAPNAVIHEGCKVGNNCFIGANVILEKGVKVGNNAYICDNTKIIGDRKIGKNVVINEQQVITQDIPEGFIKDSELGDYIRIIS